MAQPVKKKITIPSDLAEASNLQDQILREVTEAGYDERARFAIRLALDEAVSNAIHHGNKNDPTKKVTVEYRVDPQMVEISVADEGPGFNPEHIPDPTQDEFSVLPHGRGVYLIRAYMSEVYFNDRGNRVTMVKRRDCPLPQI